MNKQKKRGRIRIDTKVRFQNLQVPHLIVRIPKHTQSITIFDKNL